VEQGRNAPGELPRIAAVLAQLRGIPLEELTEATTHNARQALPRLDALLV
jgi:TatD DNase family protein